MPTEAEVKAALAVLRIRHLNDEARRHITDGAVVVTSGIASLPQAKQAAILQRVCEYNDFAVGDPFEEHDSGSFKHNGEHIVWRIDYFDRDGHYGSPDPADGAVTKRIVTIMLADDQ